VRHQREVIILDSRTLYLTLVASFCSRLERQLSSEKASLQGGMRAMSMRLVLRRVATASLRHCLRVWCSGLAMTVGGVRRRGVLEQVRRSTSIGFADAS
jgi:hypothetical protein